MNPRLFLKVVYLVVIITAGILATGGTAISLQIVAAQTTENGTAASLGTLFLWKGQGNRTKSTKC
jgi:hypothetical protein